MNNNSQSDLAKHVARVIRAMNRRKPARGESATRESDGPSRESEVQHFSAGEINSSREMESSDAETSRYPEWIEYL